VDILVHITRTCQNWLPENSAPPGPELDLQSGFVMGERRKNKEEEKGGKERNGSMAPSNFQTVDNQSRPLSLSLYLLPP